MRPRGRRRAVRGRFALARPVADLEPGDFIVGMLRGGRPQVMSAESWRADVFAPWFGVGAVVLQRPQACADEGVTVRTTEGWLCFAGGEVVEVDAGRFRGSYRVLLKA